MKISATVALAFLLMFQDAQAATVDWKIDKAHSTIGFSVRHLGIANVRGHFGEFDASIKADSDSGRVSDVEATARSASVNTGIEQRDEHLRSDDFFHAAKFPVLKLKTKTLKWDGNNVSGTAYLTIRGITKAVPFAGELLGTHRVNFETGNEIRAGYQVTTKINRHDFGLKFSKVMEGVAVAGDIVTIQIEVEMYRKL